MSAKASASGPRKYLFIGGGSGGHTVPLLAVRQALLSFQSTADIRFLTSEKQLDKDFLDRENIPYDTVPYPRTGLRFIPSFFTNYRIASRVIREWKPDVVFSKGGALSIPGCIAARLRKIPIVLHESDTVAGNANRIVAKFATFILLGFSPWKPLKEDERPALAFLYKALDPNPGSGGNPKEDHAGPPMVYERAVPDGSGTTLVTGNPVRTQMTQGSREAGLSITGFTGKKPVLLVMGGSQGAQSINDIIWKHLDALLEICDVMHLTGTGKGNPIARPGYWSSEMSSGQLHHLYAIADLAVSRAGAGSIGELAANGIPTILVPIRGLAQDHQYKNALVARDNGGCVLVLQEEMEEKLISEISRILNDDGLRSQMRKKIANLYQPNAAVRIAEIIASCVAQRKNLP